MGSAGNELESSIDAAIETLSPCDDSDGSGAPAGALGVGDIVLRDIAPTGNYQDQPEPGPQPQMPRAAEGTWEAAGGPPRIDLEAVPLPPEQ